MIPLYVTLASPGSMVLFQEARLLLQERQERHVPADDHPESLHLVVEGQDHLVHGQVSGP